MPALNVYMNDYLVGVFTKTATGAHLFQYDPAWLDLAGSRPISLSMPLSIYSIHPISPNPHPPI